MNDRMPGQRFQNPQTPSTADAPDQWTAGTGAPVPVTAERYRSYAPVLMIVTAVIVIATVVLLVVAGTKKQPLSDGSTPSASSGSTNVQPTGPTPSPGWQSIAFQPVGSSTSGYWQVSQADWSGGQATITTTVTVDQGTLRFTFFALDNKTSNFYQPADGTMMVGEVSAGHTQTGTLVLQIPRGDFTLYLANSKGVQIQALVVRG